MPAADPEFSFDRERHEYRLGGRVVPSTTQVLRAAGFIGRSFASDYSRRRGEYVHLACHLHDRGVLDEESLDPVIAPYLQAYRSFLEATKFDVLLSEEPLVSVSHRFGTTPDKLGIFKGVPALVEIKTGIVQPWVALQTAAQELAVKDRFPEYRKAKLRRYALGLRPDGTYLITGPFDNKSDREVFLGALACHTWKVTTAPAAR